MGKMAEILIKDGVKYRLWTPENEPDEFEPMVKYHVKDIFGKGCEYFPKQKLKTLADNRSIPDGFVIDFENQKWYIVENKLLCDDAIRRISSQIVRYKNAIRNPQTRLQIFNSIYSEVNKPEMHQFLYDLIINRNPEIVILINSIDGELGEQFEDDVGGTDKNVKIVVFKTFARDFVDPRKSHLHLITHFMYDVGEPAFVFHKDMVEPKVDITKSGSDMEHVEGNELHKYFAEVYGGLEIP
ncbi:MAG: hypothetical protein A7316_04430 [Candidatus Altiarchaeales archaeon WOR_SM1_86-2]|nr:MAG: hypothetical protein A7316_04430 [Candidatus Altiarchaeales archaeon WOR_SM1_86-2]